MTPKQNSEQRNYKTRKHYIVLRFSARISQQTKQTDNKKWIWKRMNRIKINKRERERERERESYLSKGNVAKRRCSWQGNSESKRRESSRWSLFWLNQRFYLGPLFSKKIWDWQPFCADEAVYFSDRTGYAVWMCGLLTINVHFKNK